MIRDYFRKLDRRRAVIMIIGNVFTGMGISIFKLSGLGNDPFSGMVMALSDCTGIQYAFFLILVNLVIFIAEITMGRELIGLGTAVNALLLGYIVTFFFWNMGGDAGNAFRAVAEVIDCIRRCGGLQLRTLLIPDLRCRRGAV